MHTMQKIARCITIIHFTRYSQKQTETREHEHKNEHTQPITQASLQYHQFCYRGSIIVEVGMQDIERWHSSVYKTARQARQI